MKTASNETVSCLFSVVAVLILPDPTWGLNCSQLQTCEVVDKQNAVSEIYLRVRARSRSSRKLSLAELLAFCRTAGHFCQHRRTWELKKCDRQNYKAHTDIRMERQYFSLGFTCLRGWLLNAISKRDRIDPINQSAWVVISWPVEAKPVIPRTESARLDRILRGPFYNNHIRNQLLA